MPEKARAVARDLGVPYYETSVLTFYGIDELFENAIRAALCSRRSQRFWMTGLKKVMQPALQVSLAKFMNSKTHLQNFKDMIKEISNPKIELISGAFLSSKTRAAISVSRKESL